MQRPGPDVTDSLVHLVVAVDAEAKPLISWFGLRRQQPDRGFPVFRHAHIALVVSGPGKANAAAATAHLHAACGYPRNALWVNIGVAGHRDLPVGSCQVAHAITDSATGRNWYPPQAITPPWPGAPVMTVDTPDTDYACGELADMEASGFYATACRFSTSELVQVVKVVSDNAGHPAENLRASHLTALLGQQLDALDLFLHRLGRLANELSEGTATSDEELAPWLARWTFSVTQRRQLAEQLRRLKVLDGTPTQPQDASAARSAEEVIRTLAERAGSRPLPLP